MNGFRILPLLFLLPVLYVNAQEIRPASPKPANVPVLKVEPAKIAAEVNGDKITQEQLAAECLRIHGEEELKDLIKKTLIQTECSRKNITVSQDEINTEIERMAKTFKFSTEEWLKLLQEERGLTAEQYMQDIIYPILAIGKLAGSRLNISEDDINAEYNARFGPAVQVRQIVLGSRSDAEKVLAEVKANPESFASVAKNKSLDPVSQPYGGMIHPIRHGSLGNTALERIVFDLKPGEISDAVELTAGQFLIFRCEQHLAPQDVDRQKVREQIVIKIRDAKTRKVAAEVFQELQSKAKIQAVLGNPAAMQQFPDIAAVVNGQPLTKKQLSDVCVNRFGKRVLEDMINRLIVEQDCRKHNIVITEADIDNEIKEMAMKNLPLKADGTPNIELWMKMATEGSGVKPGVYRTNTIFPVLALKRLARPYFQVTEDDVQRGFEANFGKKVRCLAMTFDEKDQRRAQEVWEKANRQRTAENFGDLADKYSSDSDSRLSRGVIAPIGRYCGQPALEEEAFGLLPNELSQIIQVDDKLVILFCLGYEEAVTKDINDVKADLVADIFEKKQKIAVERYFDSLYRQAAFDNYLTGVSQNPQVEKAIQEAGKSELPKTASGTNDAVR
ncbi:MAG: peptidylprolyl isomerase [Planctomycetaceae bacterium]|jgi:parvulin-like peptidyl-prolyl isomerase|nr:peptidylprolyl isomerase [Planctomycetaceae bacterium]